MPCTWHNGKVHNEARQGEVHFRTGWPWLKSGYLLVLHDEAELDQDMYLRLVMKIYWLGPYEL